MVRGRGQSYSLRMCWGSPKPLGFSENIVAPASSTTQNAFSQVDNEVIRMGLLWGEEKHLSSPKEILRLRDFFGVGL